MAYTYCENCGEKIDDLGNFCPHCGYSKDGKGPSVNGGAQYGRNDNGSAYGDNAGGYGQGGYGSGGYGERPYRTPFGGPGGGAPLYRVPMPQGNRRVGRINTVVMVFSVAVTLFFNMICGILAIWLALSAPNQPTQEMETKKNQKAMLVNILGIVLACVARVVMYFLWGE